jgi:gentisate 1,2-dioxygenase
MEGLMNEVIQLESLKGATVRRVLTLSNPGLGPNSPTSKTLSAAIQIVPPGEVAEAHRHTAAAIRFIIQGNGAYTVQDGERFVMEEGDLVLTPNFIWHDHGNETSKPMIWLDCLDAPLIGYLDAMLQEPFYENTQPVTKPVGYTNNRIGNGLMRGIADTAVKPLPITYKWPEALRALSESGSETPFDGIAMEYINPLNGGHTMPTIACRLHLLRLGDHTGAHRHTGNTVYHVASGRGFSVIDGIRVDWERGNTVYHVASGRGFSVIDGIRVDWERGDTFVLPPLAWHEHGAESAEDAVLFSLSDVPVLEALQLYREEEGSPQEVAEVLA